MRLLTFATYDPVYAKAYREKQRAKREVANRKGDVSPPPKPKTLPPPRSTRVEPVAQSVVKLNRGEELLPVCACTVESTPDGLTSDQYDVLVPGHTKSAVTKSLNVTARGKTVLDQIIAFTERHGGVSRARKAIDQVASGENLSAQLRTKVKDFIGALNGFPTERVPQLYRGFAIKITDDTRAGWDALESSFRVGATMKMNVSSFTSSVKQAEQFQKCANGTRSVGSNYTQWRLIVDGPMHALPVENLSKFKYEKEWFGGGEFVVTQFDRATRQRPWYEVHIRQVNSLEVPK